MPDWISVHDYIGEWVRLDDRAYEAAVDRVTEGLSRDQPLAHLIRLILDGGVKPLAADPERRDKLLRVSGEHLAGELRAGLEQVSRYLPPRDGRIRCRLMPSIGKQGSGVCFAPDQIIVCVPVDGNSRGWLLPTAVHEYSHTHRAFNLHEPVTIRDNLIFEGLAMILPEVVAPWPIAWPEPTPEEEAEFWDTTDLDAHSSDPDAHARYMANSVAYGIATRIVRRYLDRYGLSIVAAHHFTNDELYWNSGYPGIR